MNVAFISYPMLFQMQGGLQIQMRETMNALNLLGCDARLIDPVHERLSSFDVCHVFASINGNFRIVEYCKMLDVPVVLSPLLRPHWTRWLAVRAAICTRVSGRITHWAVRSEYQEIRFALNHADRLVALGNREKESLINAFNVAPGRIDVISNGIPDRFFRADPKAFLEAHGLAQGFILNVGSIDPHKNQLSLAKAVTRIGKQLVMIGPCKEPNRAYLADVLAMPGTRYLGPMEYDDPLLPSAYAAASVFCLPSYSEVLPLSALESLAAGTPVVVTMNNCMDTDSMKACLIEISPTSTTDIATGIERMLTSRPSPSTCRKPVLEATWESVAKRLLQCYRTVLAP